MSFGHSDRAKTSKGMENVASFCLELEPRSHLDKWEFLYRSRITSLYPKNKIYEPRFIWRMEFRYHFVVMTEQR